MLVTHTHCDHAKDLRYVVQGQSNLVYVPGSMIGHDQWDHQNKLSCARCAQFDPKSWNVRSCEPGDVFNLPTVQEYQVEAFGMNHSVPCIGYGIAPIRGGERSFVEGFVYCGDTSIEVFDKCEEALTRYGHVIIE